MPFDHIGFNVANFLKSRDFYIRALAPLGMAVLHEREDWAAFGESGKVRLWIGEPASRPARMHIAFTAADHAAIRAFHAAATEAGGTDNGAPGYRPQYHPDYFAAFVLDPDGNNIEAVCHRPSGHQGD